MSSRSLLAFVFAAAAQVAVPASAQPGPCNAGVVYEDGNGNGRRDGGEAGLAGVRVSDGRRLATTDAQGRYDLPVESGRTVFVIKPAGFSVPTRRDGMPDFWRHLQPDAGPVLRYGGLPAGPAACHDFGLRPERAPAPAILDVLVFGDPQPKTATDVDYFRRDIVQPLVGRPSAALGLTLGDVVHDDLDLLDDVKRTTAALGLPWLHAAGNHDMDFDAGRDEDSLLSFRREFGPDTFAWEEPQANFIVLDDVVYLPGQKPEYTGGLREDQFAFLEAYLELAPRDRLLVVAAHVPFFDTAPEPDRETFRRADRERLFALLAPFPKVLLLTAHGHVQRHHFHGPGDGWAGELPLHEYNAGAACGGYWAGLKDAEGIPDATMADGTPNGYATLQVAPTGHYSLRWHVARPPSGDRARTAGMALHAPRVLRRGAFPAFAVYANVFMGFAGSVVEYRIDGGAWQRMRRVERADPGVLAENAADDASPVLRGYDRLPEATVSTHLWRGSLPTDLAAGEHRIEVRTLDPWRGELVAETIYRLEDAAP